MKNVLVELFILLILVLISPIIARILKLPAIVVETLLGILLGPSVLGVLVEEKWLTTLALMGFIYLMFLVGLEVDLEIIRGNITKVFIIALGSFLTPLSLGYLLGIYYGLPPEFIGLALSTTSMGVVLPTVRELLAASRNSQMAQVLLGSSIVVDILSMLAMAFIIEKRYFSIIQASLLIASLASLIVALHFLKRWEPSQRVLKCFTTSHVDIRLSLTLIFGFSTLAEFLGVHAIIGAFAAGILISELEEKVEGLMEKLLGFGYGFFIPIFFITVGIRTDLRLVFGTLQSIEILVALLLVGFLGKILGTFITSRGLGFNSRESLSIAFAMNARLSLIIAAAEIGLSTGLINLQIYSILTLLAILSVLLSPFLAKIILGAQVPKIPVGEEIP